MTNHFCSSTLKESSYIHSTYKYILQICREQTKLVTY